MDLKEDDKLTFKRVEDNLVSNDELTKVLMGDNTDDVKFEYFNKKVMDNIIDVYGEKFDLYKKIMNDKVFPQFVNYMFQSVVKHHRDS
jgi:hypothetical protein